MFGNTKRAVRSELAKSELPAEVTDFIAGIVRRTRLRRAEQIEVAAELASHFAEGLARGKPADGLIRQYGDPRESARALREAAICKRSAADRALRSLRIWSTRGAIAAVAGYAIAAGVLSLRSPTITIDGNAVINGWAPKPGAEGPAIDLYVEALADENGVWQSGLNNPDIEPWEFASRLEFDPVAREALRAWLGERRHAIEILREVRNRRALGMPLHLDLLGDERLTRFFAMRGYGDRSVFGTLLPHLAMLRRATAWLSADAALAAHDGRMDDFIADVDAMFATARHAGETRFMVSAIVAGRIRELALQTLISAIENHGDRLDDARLAALDARLRAGQVDFSESVARSLEGERLMVRDLLQRCYTDDGSGDGVALARELARYESLLRVNVQHPPDRPEVVDFLSAPLVAAIAPSRAQVAQEFEQAYDDLERAVRAPTRAESFAIAREFDKRLEEGARESRDIGSLLRLTLATPGRQVVMRWRDAATVESALAAVGLERFRREHGRFPTDLAELARFAGCAFGSASGSQPEWRYALVDGRPLIYDAGIDRLDDRARTPLQRAGSADIESVVSNPAAASHPRSRLVSLSALCPDSLQDSGDRKDAMTGQTRVTLRMKSAVGADQPLDPAQPIVDVDARAGEVDGDFIRVWWKSGAAGADRIVPAREPAQVSAPSAERE